MNIPTSLFRYESPSIQNIQNLKQRIVYFSSPRKFNDPFDCAIKIFFDKVIPTDEEIVEIRESPYLNELFGSHGMARFKYATNDALKDFARVTVEQAMAYGSQDRGVVCMTETNHNLLMWSHYAAQHRGWCLEFSTGAGPFFQLHKVMYQDSFPQFKLMDILDLRMNMSQFLHKAYCTKSSEWSYEMEWRAFDAHPNTPRVYGPGSLRAVYFGARCVPETIQEVRNAIGASNSEIDMWKAKKSESSFNIEFEQING